MKIFGVIVIFVIAALGASYSLYHPLPGANARNAVGDVHSVSLMGRTIEYYAHGDGPRVVLLASAGREASDFNELRRELVAAGYRTVAVEAPGIGGSTRPDTPLSLFDVARDVKTVIDDDATRTGGDTAVGIGHAFGNRIARAAASQYPEQVKGVILLAAGGQRPIDKSADAALKGCFDPKRTAAQRLNDIRTAFFADGNEIPAHWRRGWHWRAAKLQGAATKRMGTDEWQSGGAAPMLIVQAAHDRIAPPVDASDILKAANPDRVEVVLIGSAGHALLPEQPDAIVDAVINFLGRIAPAGTGK